MDFKNLKEFISIAKEAGVAELKYEDGDKKFEIGFPVAHAAPVAMTYASAPAHMSAQSAPGAPAVKKSDLKEITSPFVGTFYVSPSPDAEPYAKIGDKISKGQVLCIVEAMKIMNEIESEVTGEIVEICVDNETYVEFGQVLYRVRP